MDDRYAYMLNALWARHYDLGRVVRFRHVQRGRQSVTYEVLTAEQRTYSVYLFGPGHDPAALRRMAEAIATLDQHRFSVVPMMKSKDDQWTVDGPQGQAMMVSLNTDGQPAAPETWTAHDLSQLGLRLGWMHRLLKEQVPLPPAEPGDLRRALEGVLHKSPTELPHRMPQLDPALTAPLLEGLADFVPTGWCHGDVQPAAFLLDHDRQICTIVDWPLLHPGNPLEDVVDAFTHWCVLPDATVNPETARALLEAYRSLCPMDKTDWMPSVHAWCAQRIIHAAGDRAPLPRGFSHILSNPAALAQAIELCEAK